ncbi:MAG: shikimate dehydrogenase [Chitinophagaceae bacterium]
MRQFGLIGYPLSHSFSKKYFTEKFEREELHDCLYENYPIASIDELTDLLKNNPLLEGINVTIPYKEQVLSFLFQQSAVVKRIKACNCIKIEKGKLVGYNTDVAGFELSLTPKLDAGHKQALILGTGGAAKAVAYVLSRLGIRFSYVSRKATAENFSYDAVTPELLASHTLVINTTPSGMYPEVTECPPIPYHALTSHHYLFDLIYNPAKTLFLQKGEEQGAVTKNGGDMLLIQAEESWKIWNGIMG